MKRDRSDGTRQQSNKTNIVDKNCPKCNHNRMWTSRGGIGFSKYLYKCTRCSYEVSNHE